MYLCYKCNAKKAQVNLKKKFVTLIYLHIPLLNSTEGAKRDQIASPRSVVEDLPVAFVASVELNSFLKIPSMTCVHAEMHDPSVAMK